jgi:predicted metal-dependent phosphoesterase TrpH
MRAMLIDLHTHSTASDGALAPVELLQRAVSRGVDCFALTDHDTVAGYGQLSGAALALPDGFELLTGVELSCRWSNTTIHIVGLGMALDHPALVEGLRELDEARGLRAARIGERLEKAGFPGGTAGARQRAGASQVGRPHFARWLVDEGHVPDMNTAFDKYLGAGKIGDVKAFWPVLSQAVAWITRSGGRAVLAHPVKYRFTNMKLRRLVRDFVDAGGQALEVFSGRQTAEQTSRLAALATEFSLRISAGSDFHRDGPYLPGLGLDTAELPSLPAVWDREVAA